MTAKTTPTTDDAETGLRLLLRVSSDYVTGVGLTGVPARQFQAVLAIHLLASVAVEAGLALCRFALALFKEQEHGSDMSNQNKDRAHEWVSLNYPDLDLDGDAYDLAVEAAAAELDLLDAAADRVDAGQAVRK